MTNPATSLTVLATLALAVAACAGESPTTPASGEVQLHRRGHTMSEWSAATPIATINTPTFTEGCPAVLKSGDVLYLASNRPGGFGNLDLYVSYRDRRTGAWSTPVNLGPSVNTASNEQCPLVLNSREMVFVSDRPGGAGGLDLWMATRTGRGHEGSWGSPVNLALLNTSAAEFGPGAYRNGGTSVLYFNSNRPGGAGGHDIYVSTRPRGGDFSAPAPVTELNTPAEEQFPGLSRDGREIIFATNRMGGPGGLDLWTATRRHSSDAWGPATNLGPNVNSPAVEGRSTISHDGRTLIFHSTRAGSADLYESTRARARHGDDGDDDDDDDDGE